jgi:hypothetical protein
MSDIRGSEHDSEVGCLVSDIRPHSILARDVRASEGLSRRFAISCLTLESPGLCEESPAFEQQQQVLNSQPKYVLIRSLYTIRRRLHFLWMVTVQ